MTSEERLSFLLHSGPVVVFEVSLDWTPLFISQNIQEVLGYSIDRYFDDPQFSPGLLHPEDREDMLGQIRATLEVDKTEVEGRVLRADGAYLYVRAELNLVRNAEGEPERIIGFFLNCTKDVEQKVELQRQKQQLEDANESLEQFVYVASHDLREPLIGVAGYVSLVLKRYGDCLDDQGRHFLEEAGHSCKNMEQKIDDLLELSRAGCRTLNESFPLGAAVEQAKRILASSVARRGAIVRYENLPLVRGDRGQIAQAFQNLFSNSIKYQEKEVTPLIEVTAETYAEDPTYWLVSVKDNGIGFDMRHADRIFGVFQRLYTVDQYPGTGIGLAIVKKIIDKHSGKIWVSSKPGAGTTFYFTLAKPDC